MASPFGRMSRKPLTYPPMCVSFNRNKHTDQFHGFQFVVGVVRRDRRP
jgi:hypothetical protein